MAYLLCIYFVLRFCHAKHFHPHKKTILSIPPSVIVVVITRRILNIIICIYPSIDIQTNLKEKFACCKFLCFLSSACIFLTFTPFFPAQYCCCVHLFMPYNSSKHVVDNCFRYF